MSILFSGLLIDAYGTIFKKRISGTLPKISKKIIEHHNLSMSINEFVNLWSKIYFSLESKYLNKKTFKSIYELNELSLKYVGEKLKLNIEASFFVNDLFEELKNAKTYTDAKPFICWLNQEKIPFVIVSNIDDEIIFSVIEENALPIRYGQVITSQKAKSYKPDVKIYHLALSTLSIPKSDILHIGDNQSADIIGAKKIGIKMCWVNRNKEKLQISITPDYIVSSLLDVKSILR